jgi:hypothetical protein
LGVALALDEQAMRKALLFRDAAELSDFVRACGGSDASPTRGGYALYWTRDPARSASEATLALFGWKWRDDAAAEWTGEPIDLKRVDAEEQDGELVCRRDGERFALRIFKRQPAETLLELIQPAPWKDEPAETGRVLFWLHDETLLPKLVGDSLRLGNDRLQFARLARENSSALLLRAESPSHYLLEWCREERPGAVDLFYSPAEDLHIEWGFVHPLEDLWKRSTKPRGGEWLFFRSDRPRQAVQPVRWSDIYDAARFDLSFPAESAWTQTDSSVVRFTIPLEFKPRTHLAEPELWLLRESERPALERLLAVVDQEDLGSLLLSVQKAPEGAGERIYFVREKREGTQGRKFLDFGGQRFASYKGFHNLFLPVDRELQPQLRRDRYRAIFELKQGEMAVAAPSGANPQNPVRIWRFAESSFEPFERLVDYIIDADAQVLETIVERGVFDFGHYALAPKRPDLAERPDRPKPEKPEKPESTRSRPGGEAEALPSGTAPGRTLDRPGIPAAFARTDLEKREAALEKEIVKEGQTVERWSNLAKLKTVLEKRGDATQCLFDALWLVPTPQQAEPLRRELRVALDKWLESVEVASREKKRKRKERGEEGEVPADFGVASAAVAREVLRGGELPAEGVDAWLRSASKALRGSERELRVKERWLLWGEILTRNRDAREQARVREEIRVALSRDGLGLEDVPLFIRNRIFLDRELQQDLEGGDDAGAGEYRAALDNLRTVEEGLGRFPGAMIKKVGMAILARACARRLGEADRAGVFLERALENAEKLSPGMRAWIDLYAAHAFDPHSAARAKQFRDRAEEGIKALRSEEKKIIRELEESLEGREKADNPAEFLSKQNIQRFYPQTTSQGRDGQDIFQRLSQAWEAGDNEKATQLATEALTHLSERLAGAKGKSADVNYDAPKLLYLVIDVVDKLRWSGDGARLAALFETFARGVDGENLGKSLYGSLVNAAVSSGLLRLRRERWAADQLNMSLRRVGELKVALDFIDVCSALLNVVEGLPVAQRARPLKLAMDALGEQIAREPKNWESQWTAPFALKLLDQTVEAAVGKDKLALGYYKEYLQRDEMLVLERVLRENFCA